MHLVLIKKWFDAHLVLNGKNEEYREITPYWCSRFLVDKTGINKTRNDWDKYLSVCVADSLNIKISHGAYSFKHIETITYSNGMKPIDILPRFQKDVKSIRISQGKEEWGAEKNKLYFVIEHSTDAYNLKNC